MMLRDPELFETIQHYLDGLFYCNTGKLKMAFHKDAFLFDAEKGCIFAEPCALFINGIGEPESTSPFNLGQEPESELLLVDWLSGASAVVKLRIRARRNVYLDHLCLVQGQEGWKLVSKVWTLERVVDERLQRSYAGAVI